jgi:predicted Rossmann fold nucleotide-binding protein DprA/Smf involved in DNA uptake
MTDEPEDLREFIRWHTARSDRVLREVMAESGRVHREVMARSNEVIERNRQTVERNSQVMERVIAELDDQRDERRALINAVLRLIDRIDRWEPGGASA